MLYSYDMRPCRKGAREIVKNALAQRSTLQAGEFADLAGISRQAAHRHLAILVREGYLLREGKGRATRYRLALPAEIRLRFPLKGLTEDGAWKEVRARASPWTGVPENADRILYYAFTELVNNAIDHSGGQWLDLLLPQVAGTTAFEVLDDGIGIFEHVRRHFNLPDRLAALQEISKGKLTTLPERHTGEGIFFVSKIADYFEVDSGGLSWKVDNQRGDVAIGERPGPPGTRVRFEVSPARTRTLADLFAEYTRDFEFSKTRIVVRLFTLGPRFVSRSEAKRILQGLERFREVVLDFAAVPEVGQGFADEIFRVWARSHPSIALIPVNMGPTVKFMVDRARPAASDSGVS